MNFPEDLQYTKEHEWVRTEAGVGTIGITDYAQGELGDVIYIDIAVGKEVKQGESFGSVELSRPSAIFTHLFPAQSQN
jgi:glycine cleavage system H protein